MTVRLGWLQKWVHQWYHNSFEVSSSFLWETNPLRSGSGIKQLFSEGIPFPIHASCSCFPRRKAELVIYPGLVRMG
jgi:hypothetical protein